MRWQNMLYALFAVGIMISGTSWFMQNFELQPMPEFTGYKGEARSNNLFAARLYLKRMGLPAERSEGLLNLPVTNSVIMLNTERYSLSPEKTAELLGWVSRGGHLITRARVDIEDQLQAEADDQNRFNTEDRDLLQEQLGISIDTHQMPDDAELPMLFQPANSDETLGVELDFFNALSSDDPQATQYYLGEEAWFIDQPHGAGHISLLTTLNFFENHNLDSADHAKLLWYLVQSHKGLPERILLVHQDTLPSLFTLLWRHAFALLASLSLLLVFIFWALMPRFGALIQEPPPQRRRLLEHIKASGHFLWQRQDKGQQQLCQTMQRSVRQLARQHIPGWQFLSEEQQYTALADHLQKPPPTDDPQHNSTLQTTLKHLPHLLSAQTLDEPNFTRLVQIAKRIRNAI